MENIEVGDIRMHVEEVMRDLDIEEVVLLVEGIMRNMGVEYITIQEDDLITEVLLIWDGEVMELEDRIFTVLGNQYHAINVV